jgi:hypothetical protein
LTSPTTSLFAEEICRIRDYCFQPSLVYALMQSPHCSIINLHSLVITNSINFASIITQSIRFEKQTTGPAAATGDRSKGKDENPRAFRYGFQLSQWDTCLGLHDFISQNDSIHHGTSLCFKSSCHGIFIHGHRLCAFHSLVKTSYPCRRERHSKSSNQHVKIEFENQAVWICQTQWSTWGCSA